MEEIPLLKADTSRIKWNPNVYIHMKMSTHLSTSIFTGLIKSGNGVDVVAYAVNIKNALLWLLPIQILLF